MTEQKPTRREWFDCWKIGPDNGLCFSCPCCGYPTLNECGADAICYLCDWQDDGQDDPHADAVWGGPNKRYSLTQARENFKRYFVMYSPDNDTRITSGDSQTTLEAKRAILQAFDAMPPADQDQEAQLWATVELNRNVLKQETKRRIREYENAIGSRFES